MRDPDIEWRDKEIARLTDEVIRVRTQYEQLEIHNIKLYQEIARLRHALSQKV